MRPDCSSTVEWRTTADFTPMRKGAGIPDPANSGSQLRSDVLPWSSPPQGPNRNCVPYFFLSCSRTVVLGERLPCAAVTYRPDIAERYLPPPEPFDLAI